MKERAWYHLTIYFSALYAVLATFELLVTKHVLIGAIICIVHAQYNYGLLAALGCLMIHALFISGALFGSLIAIIYYRAVLPAQQLYKWFTHPLQLPA